MTEICDVNWGSHGCMLDRGHDGHCECSCCECPADHDHSQILIDEDGVEYLCVAKYPYYGPETRFYGEDVRSRGLP